MQQDNAQKSQYAFYTTCACGRPIRLSESTRRFAWESLQGKYGDEAMKTPAVSLDEVPNYDSLSDYKKYDAALALIVRQCSVRILAAEKLCGASKAVQLGMADNGRKEWIPSPETIAAIAKKLTDYGVKVLEVNG